MVKKISYTIYEKARIIGARALQLSMGAPPLTDVGDEFVSPVSLAKREFEANLVPLKIVH